MNERIAESEKYLFHVYNRFPVEFDHGKGMKLYDSDGNEYIDFGSGIGVNAFGYNDEEYIDSITSQAKKLLHVSNLYYHSNLCEAARSVCEVSGMDKVFFTNSGAEAIEGALKTAKKFGYLRDGRAGHEIIAMRSSFHGRTVGALSVTGTDSYREPFYPLMDGVKFADYNDIESVRAAINENTIAIILEPIQGEGGLVPAQNDFIRDIDRLCRERGLLLILDEIQCGMGRTGRMFAYEHYGVKPDIITMAKALGGGLPVGAFAVRDEVAKASLVPGDHGTTYGGNPLVLEGVVTSIRLIRERELCLHVQRTAPYLERVLDELVSEFDSVHKRRGMGFMQGLVLDSSIKAGDVVQMALEEGLIILSAGGNVLRFLPPLVANEDDIDVMKGKLSKVLKKL